MISMNRSRAWSILGGFLITLPLVGSAVPAYADDDDSWTDAAPAPAADVTVDNGYEDTDPSAPTAFQSDLSPYGSWVTDDTYGTVWVPAGSVVGDDFAPYQSSGHWALDDDGQWLWVSDYSWGYIPFHYGRWVWIGERGWSWIPGRAYAPSWAVWRVGADGYIGWAPMPPAYYWTNGSVVGIRPPPAAYSFCETRYVFSDDVHGHVGRDRATVTKAAGSTRPFTNIHLYLPAQPSVKDAHLSAETPPRHGVANPQATGLSKAPPLPRPMSGSTKPSVEGRGTSAPSRNIRPIEVKPATEAHSEEARRPSESTVSGTSHAVSRQTSRAPGSTSHAVERAPATRTSSNVRASHPQMRASRPATANHPAAPVAAAPAQSHKAAAPIRSAPSRRK